MIKKSIWKLKIFLYVIIIFTTNLVLVQHTDVYLSKQLELPQLDNLYSKKDDLHFDSNNQIRRKLSIFHLVHIDPNIQRQLISMILNNENFIQKKDLFFIKKIISYFLSKNSSFIFSGRCPQFSTTSPRCSEIPIFD